VAARKVSSDWCVLFQAGPSSQRIQAERVAVAAGAGRFPGRGMNFGSFGHRLRAAGVSIEDRKALLGQKVDDITTHYSAPDLAHLLECAERACDEKRGTVLRVCMQNGGKNGGKMRRVPATAASR